jgi:hypothetical protein
MGRPKLNPDTIKKICPMCNLEFEVSFYLRNRRTYCSKKCSNNDPVVINKMISSQFDVFQKKYGMHPMKTDKTKENLKKSVMEKHGVDWISKKEGWYDKIKENNIKKHGLESFNNREKSKQTCLQKYGVDNPSKYKEIMDSINQTKLTIHYNSLKEYCQSNNLLVLFDRLNYIGYEYKNKYLFKCTKCNYVFEVPINNSFGHLYCEKCDPDKKLTLENSFFDFLSSLTPPVLIKRHDRTILYGKELDFYLPEKKIAFELNGLYWHSENGFGLSKHYHLNKTKGCIAHGIRLIHIFENEWRDNPELIKSVIKTILKCNVDNIIYARECIIKEVSAKEKNEFLNKNHLQQEDKSTIKIGLYNNNNLVSIMTFRKSRFDNKIEWELSRFCNSMGTIISGGASKLLKYFINTYSPKSIVSYNDRRYFSGDLYPKLGFEFVSNTSPSYHYITPDYKNTINRMSFQKHLLEKKLSIFDETLSEWENMKNNGFDRIWDCGCGKWVLKCN